MSDQSYSDFLKFNICGKYYDLSRKCLMQNHSKNLPETFLEEFAKLSHEERLDLCQDYSAKNEAYVFFRSSEIFEAILCYYGADGSDRKVHCPSQICEDRFMEELQFWKIDMQAVSQCCQQKLEADDHNLRSVENLRNISRSFDTDETQSVFLQVPTLSNGTQFLNSTVQFTEVNNLNETLDDPSDEFEKLFLGKSRRVLWHVLEDPSSSVPAKIFGAISVVFVLTSVISLILGSLEVCQKPDGEPVDALTYIESACVAWFTFEYLSRFLVSSRKWQYVKKPINLIDLVSVLPFYIELGLIVADVNTEKLQNIKGALLVMRILRVLRVARLFRLARYSGGMKSFGQTLTASKNEIGMLLMFLSTTVILFSTTVYFMEKEAKETPFTSIPATFWWCVVTMTTVGYGDMIPVTIGGKLVASLTTISGVIVLAFPITMIVENFNKGLHTN